MPRITHFEIGTDDPAKIMPFYQKTFGWKFKRIAAPIEYYTIKTGEGREPGIDGGLFKKSILMSKAHNVIEIPSIDEYIAAVKKNGGSMATPKVRAHGIGKLAVFRDPEGNEFGLLEPEPE